MMQTRGPVGRWRRLALLTTAACFGSFAVMLAWPQAAVAQAPAVAAAPAEEALSQAQLEQMLAPIALYPDDLLMQMLMAATYPLEIVQAKRWLGQAQNAALRGDALVQALNAQSWDASVKSLVPFPDVLGMMNDQLEWTQQLGDAVLAQQEDVLNAIQALRGRAQAAGQLQTGAQQTVTVVQNVNVAPATAGSTVAPPPQIITIAPTNPQQVFVPVYDPNVVFGTWPHPGYPPVFYPPPVGWGVGNAILTGMAFAGGVAIVGSLWGWARPGWGNGNVNLDVNRVNNINVNRNQITGNTWRHDVTHRGGVAYSNREVNNRFRGDTVNRAQSREQFRGRTQEIQQGGGLGSGNRPGGGDRPNLGDRPGGGDRPSLGDRPGGGDRPNLGGNRPGGGDRPNLGDRPGGDRPNLGGNRPGGGDRPNLGDRPGGGDRPNTGGNRPGGGDRPNLGDRPGGGDRPNTGGNRPGGGDRPSPGDRPGGGDRPNLGANRPAGGAQRPATLPSGRPQAPQQRPSAPPALQGMGQGRDVRAAAERGQASRQAQPAARQQMQQRGGGGAAAARGGGGGRGGGRGGR